MEILEAANTALQPPPHNMTVKPRATRDSKTPTAIGKQLSLLLRNWAGSREHCSCSGKPVPGGVSNFSGKHMSQGQAWLCKTDMQLFTFLV